MQQLFETWSILRPQLSPRTAAYAMEPLGVGTSMSESLTSYIVRLAEAHSVTVGDFIGRLLSIIPNPKGTLLTRTALEFRAGGHGFHACGYRINGNSDWSAKWVNALDIATGRSDLRYLTLASLGPALRQPVFRRCRAWCPACLEHWRSTGQVAYEPLAWAIELSCCPLHKLQLRTRCHHCRFQLSPMGVYHRIGYCSRCDGWLGTTTGNAKVDSGTSSQQLRATERIGELLAMLPCFTPETSCERFHVNLTAYLEKVAGGNVAALAEYIQCPRSILQNWLDRKSMPSIDSLLRIAQALNVSVASLFYREALTATNIVAAKQAIAALGNRNVSRSRPASDICKALRRAIKKDPPVSLSDVARSLGYRTTERLYLADRRLCHAIAARYRKSGRSHWWRKPGATRICEGPRMKQILEESLKSKDPVSVHHIAARLGYSNDGYIQKKFPELCAAIGRKIAERKQASLEAMHQSLEKALEEYPAPTLIELARRLGCTTSSTLRSYHPELCDRILARYRTQLEERRRSLRKAAEFSLDETPAPTVHTVCERLGITAWFMNQYFPDVGHRIAERHLRWKAADTARRRSQLGEVVQEIAKEVYTQGLYPSVPRIADRVPPGYRCEWTTFNAAVRQAQIALGIISVSER
jgi:transcriptional regulator with XRE-family HTH domain